MFAVIRTGGKQYKVAVGDVVRVEKLEVAEGASYSFDDVLMVVDGAKVAMGEPTVKGASVKADVLGQDRAEKIIVFKKQRRKNHRRKKGHRQLITVLRVTDIKAV
jgi:large subunit ribosomal protein L21